MDKRLCHRREDGIGQGIAIGLAGRCQRRLFRSPTSGELDETINQIEGLGKGASADRQCRAADLQQACDQHKRTLGTLTLPSTIAGIASRPLPKRCRWSNGNR